ncbi:unnamed protein product [Musa acuminata subsp. malaccensis]|uniref:(wild Malaysian banana) hypothetical protein n=1 Tax=Musa acuminata subsp. malaccensis TaxID=214687 RepID=A0A804HRB0_MUSAM|nr:unnamed protein product [Musa acuminata subsp. malaccensis]
MRSGLSTSLLLILLVFSIGNSQCRIMSGEAPSRVADYARGRSKLMRYRMGFATGRSIHGDAAEVLDDTKRAIPGGPDPQHHSVNP